MLNYRDESELRAAIERLGSINAVCREYDLPRSTVQSWAKHHQINSNHPRTTQKPKQVPQPKRLPRGSNAPERASAKIAEDTATLVSQPNPLSTATLTTDELLLQHGLTPSEWDVKPTLNVWDALTGSGGVTTLAQLKVICTRKWQDVITPPHRPPSWQPPRAKRNSVARRKAATWYDVVLPDPHAPLYEDSLVEASIAWMEQFKPRRVIGLGDTADNSPWKRHRPNPRIDCTPQEAADSTYDLLCRWSNASASADERILLPGNHDWWLYQRILETIPGLASLKKPATGERWLNMSDFLSLPQIGWRLLDTEGEYHDVTMDIADDLVGLHGTKTGTHGGAVKEFALWEGVSVVQGHDHKTALVAITKRLPGGGESQRYAISAGTMARRDLGYNPAHNCNQSFLVIVHHPGGRWHPELVLYDPQRRDTSWRDWLYKPEGA